MKRKGAALWLALCLALGGCGAAPAQDTVEEDLLVVGISQVGAESDWRVANSESMKSVFTEANGYRLLFDDARQKQENQIMAVRKFIQQKVDYIVLMPLSESGWDSVLLEAKEAGIPVIVVDRMVAVEDESLFTARVGSDFLREGEIAVEWMERYVQREGVKELNILHVQGTLGSTAQIGRTQALEQGLQRNKQWRLLAQLDGDFTQAKAYEEIRRYLMQIDERPRIDVVYCENDNEAFGAIEALEEAGYVCGEDGVMVISFDATRNCLKYCMEGKIALSVECNPLLGPLVEDVIQTLEAGEVPEKYQYVEERWFVGNIVNEALIDQRPY